MQPSRFLWTFRHIEEVGLRQARRNGVWRSRNISQMGRVTFVAADSVKQMGGEREILLLATAPVADQTTLGIGFGAGRKEKISLDAAAVLASSPLAASSPSACALPGP